MGSVQELWLISYPLMLSFLSLNVMWFLERLILAKYDLNSLNASMVIGLTVNVFQYGAMGIAAIAEVLVGQYNGAAKYARQGRAIWQMIWFSVGTAVFFIPLGCWGGTFLIDTQVHPQASDFFTGLMCVSPLFPLNTALSSFFIGRGRVKFIMCLTAGFNAFNLLLDFICIPKMGLLGLIVATAITQGLQTLVLFSVFLQPQHQRQYGTGHWKFNTRLFLHGLKLGAPSALSSIFELIAWSTLAYVLTRVSQEHITVYSVCESIFTLFAFCFWGLQKGLTNVAANLIGSTQGSYVKASLYSGFKLLMGLIIFLTLPLLIFPEWFIQQFLDPNALSDPELYTTLVISLRWLWLYFALDGCTWLISAVLTARGDTTFIMIMNSVSAWCFCVIPTLIAVVILKGSPVVIWAVSSVYGCLNLISFYLRYRSKHRVLSTTSTPHINPLHTHLL
jgi:MATE family multidrug resistance protein